MVFGNRSFEMTTSTADSESEGSHFKETRTSNKGRSQMHDYFGARAGNESSSPAHRQRNWKLDTKTIDDLKAMFDLLLSEHNKLKESIENGELPVKKSSLKQCEDERDERDQSTSNVSPSKAKRVSIRISNDSGSNRSQDGNTRLAHSGHTKISALKFDHTNSLEESIEESSKASGIAKQTESTELMFLDKNSGVSLTPIDSTLDSPRMSNSQENESVTEGSFDSPVAKSGSLESYDSPMSEASEKRPSIFTQGFANQYANKLLDALDASSESSTESEQSSVHSVTSELDHLHDTIQEDTIIIQKLNNTVSIMKKKNKELECKCGRLQAKIDERNETIKTIQESKASVLEQVEEKRKTIIDLKDQLKNLAQAHEEEKQKMKDLYISLQDQTFYAAELARELGESNEVKDQMELKYMSELNGLRERVLSEMKESVREEVEAEVTKRFSDHIADLERKLEESRVQEEEKTSSFSEMLSKKEESISLLESEVSLLKQRESAAKTKLFDETSRNEDLLCKVDDLSKLNEELLEFNECIKQLVPAYRKPKIQEIESNQISESLASVLRDSAQNHTLDGQEQVSIFGLTRQPTDCDSIDKQRLVYASRSDDTNGTLSCCDSLPSFEEKPISVPRRLRDIALQKEEMESSSFEENDC